MQPVRKGCKMACCDCGLVHTINFRTRRGRIQFQAFRNNRSTALMRRHELERSVRVDKTLERRKKGFH